MENLFFLCNERANEEEKTASKEKKRPGKEDE